MLMLLAKALERKKVYIPFFPSAEWYSDLSAILLVNRPWDSIVKYWLGDGLDGMGFDYRKGQEFCLFSKSFGRAVRSPAGSYSLSTGGHSGGQAAGV